MGENEFLELGWWYVIVVINGKIYVSKLDLDSKYIFT